MRCSLTIRDGFNEWNAVGGHRDLHVRTGIAAGEPVDHNDDLYGSAVNLASRLCDAADPGHILVSDVVQGLGTHEGYTFDAGHERTLKGFPDPVPVFELLQNPT